MPIFARPSAFGEEIRRRGVALLRRTPGGRYADGGQWAVAFAYAAAFVGVYGSLLSRTPDGWSVALAGLGGLLAYCVIASFCHDAAHGSLSRSKQVNRAILFAGFALVGVSGALWGRRHVREHHMFANVDGTDIDADSTILVRLTPHRPWRAWHRLQPIYAPFLYLLVLANLAFVKDFRDFAAARRARDDGFEGGAALLEFAAAKTIHLGLAVAAPLLVLDVSVGGVLLGYATASAAASGMFVLINIGTHAGDEAAFVKPDADGRIAHDWATHQAMTAIDWAPTNPLAIALTGGANAHAAHHLFPEAAHRHNARLTRLVRAVARRHRAPHHVTSFIGMLAAHGRLLRKLARPPASG